MENEKVSPDALKNIQPVLSLPTEDPLAHPPPGIALCLSGGGYRAMLFHLGCLWRLNEAGLMKSLARISSVSGGSITAAQLGLVWKRLQFDSAGTAGNLVELVVDPVRRLANVTVDASAIIWGALTPGKSIGDKVAQAYRDHLFGNATLQALPADNEGPRFVINATNVQTKVLWRFSRPYMGDYRIGLIRNPNVELAVAVAASSAFPPVLSPVTIKLNPADFDPLTKGDPDLKDPQYFSEVVLTDGGVYDNLGLETAWKHYETILVSDGGGGGTDEPEPKGDWLRHVYRVLSIIDNQVRALRKRQVVGSYQLKLRKGAYWGIRTNILDYNLPDAIKCPFETTIKLADTKTRLTKLDGTVQERIINWGYAVCDAAIRKHLDPTLKPPAGIPYPNSGI